MNVVLVSTLALVSANCIIRFESEAVLPISDSYVAFPL